MRFLIALQRIASQMICGDRSRSGNVALIIAFSLPVLVMLAGGAVDFSAAVTTKSRLQDASDAAALAVSVEVAKNPNATESALLVIASSELAANEAGRSPTITALHVCAPVQNDCTAPDGSQMAMNTVAVATADYQPCAFLEIVPGVCTATNQSIKLTTASTTTIGFGKNLQLNLVMDSSASMIVGSTTNDVNLITTWVGNNWSLVKPGDPPPYTNADNPPCAFACHDVGSSTASSDIQLGLTHAHSAGATTRFDVMISAAQQLISHIQAEVAANPILANNTYMFNVMSFDTTLHSWGTANTTSFATAQSAVSQVVPGLDTHMSTALGSLITTVGVNGNGSSKTSPLKFLILVTDGLQSDRTQNYSSCHRGYDTAWSYDGPRNSGVCLSNQYDTTISQSQCDSFKSNGVVLAVLETPYVPLTGQDPWFAPYETTVRHVIYPGGPNTPSVVSQALQTCASPGYYFQATSDSEIATGFATLTDKFIANSAALAK